MTVNVFAVQIVFICFRECVETTIIVSVLLVFLKQTLGGEADKQIHNKLIEEIWWCVGLGLLIVLIIGCGMIGAFYGLNKDVFSGAEDLWEGKEWYFENYRWSLVTGNDASETGSGPGSYDIRQSVWHVNCWNAEFNGGGGWGIFNAILGWENSATYGTILSYNLYWLTIICVFVNMRYKEVKGRWPWAKAKKQSSVAESESSEETGQAYIIKRDQVVGVTTKSAATEL